MSNYKKIDITVSPKLFPGVLLMKDICSCGMDALKEDATIGKEYMCDLNSVRWARWTCHGCGRVTDVRLVDVYSSIAFVPIQWTLLDLLDIGAAIRPSPKPLGWEKVRSNHVAPKGFSQDSRGQVLRN